MKQLRAVVVAFLACLSVAATTAAGTGGPDGGGYLWRDSNDGVDPSRAAFIGPITTEPAIANQSVTPVALPNPIPFYGLGPQSTVFVSDNGWLAFADPVGDSAPVNLGLPDPSGPDSLLAYYWDDLNPAGGFLQHGEIAGGYAFFLRAFQGGGLVQLQIELYETGRLKVIYIAISDRSTISIGAENETGAFGTELSRDGASASGFNIRGGYAFELIPPSALTCGGVPVGCGVPIVSTTLGAGSAVTAYSCAPGTFSGGEVVVPIDVADTSSLTATLSGFAPRNLQLFYLGGCHEAFCNVGGGTSVVVPVVAAGRYYFVVDGVTPADDGAFTLTITCGAPLEPIHTGWEENPGEGVVRVAGPPIVNRGDPAEFAFSSFPADDDPNWVATPDPNFVSFSIPSTLCPDVCGASLQFTYYRTCLFLPTASTELVVAASSVDDGIALQINGTLVDTGQLGAYLSPNLIGNPALALGDLNNIEIVHVDDCCSTSALANLTFRVDGVSASAKLADSCRVEAAVAAVAAPDCAGDPVILDASPSDPGLCTTPLQYRWREGGMPLTPFTTDPTVNVSPSGTTTYSVDVLCDDGCGCLSSFDVEVVVPVAVATDVPPSVNICPGDAAVLGGMPTATGGTPPLDFLWTPASFLDDPTSPNPNAMPPGAQLYSLEVTDGRGCQVSANQLVQVSGGIPGDVGNNLRLVRESDDVLFSWVSAVNAVSYNVKWDLLKPFGAPTVELNQVVTTGRHAGAVPPPPSLYYYRVNGVGCGGEGP